jgi:hypothetical protein
MAFWPTSILALARFPAKESPFAATTQSGLILLLLPSLFHRLRRHQHGAGFISWRLALSVSAFWASRLGFLAFPSLASWRLQGEMKPLPFIGHYNSSNNKQKSECVRMKSFDPPRRIARLLRSQAAAARKNFSRRPPRHHRKLLATTWISKGFHHLKGKAERPSPSRRRVPTATSSPIQSGNVRSVIETQGGVMVTLEGDGGTRRLPRRDQRGV